VCREEDESTGYVLPKAQLSLLAHEQPSEGTRRFMQSSASV
jgi:hypothetical protein